MFNQLSDAETRDHCRARIESLELWLRRLIDNVLTAAYGVNYFDCENNPGNRLIKKRMVDNLDARIAAEPTRYPRRVDAILLDDAIAIICKLTLFAQHFHLALSNSFPGGVEAIRQMLDRVTDIRNRLAWKIHDCWRA